MRIRLAWHTFWDEVNEAVADSRVGKYFQLRARNGLFSTEVRAGTVTFLTTAYILAVNAQILADTGGPCSHKDCNPPGGPECVFPDANGYVNHGYEMCLETVRKSLVTATAASSMFGCLLMGFFANLPIATAPGMGLNAYFAYTVVGYRGSGPVDYDTALTAVFLEGLIFVLLAIAGVRAKLIELIPRSIMFAAGGGIGLYLAFIGLNSSQGLGIISFDRTTLSTLGGCPTSAQQPVYVLNRGQEVCTIDKVTGVVDTLLPPPATVFACNGQKMEAGTVWLGLGGLAIIALLMSRSFKGSIITGIIFVTVIAWIPGHAASYFGKSSPIPGGEARSAYFKRIVALPSLANTGLHLQFKGFGNGQLWIALMTFLYVDFLDTTGALISMSNFINHYVPGFLDHERRFPRQTAAYTIDGFATMAGACMGTSPVAVFIESASGIREGGRTGITAIVVGLYFLVALFFTPILASVPPYAIGPALVTVGALMMINVVRIKWDMASEALPAFLTIVIMPLTNSIAYGVIAGIVFFIFINGLNYFIDKLTEFFEVTWRGSDELPQFSQHNFIRSITSRTRPNSPLNSFYGGSGPASRANSIDQANESSPRGRTWRDLVSQIVFWPSRRSRGTGDVSRRHTNGSATPGSPISGVGGRLSSSIGLESPFASIDPGPLMAPSPSMPRVGSGLPSESSKASGSVRALADGASGSGDISREVGSPSRDARPGNMDVATPQLYRPSPLGPRSSAGDPGPAPAARPLSGFAASPAPPSAVPRRRSIVDMIQEWDTFAKENAAELGLHGQGEEGPTDMLRTSVSGWVRRRSIGRSSIGRTSIERTTSAPERRDVETVVQRASTSMCDEGPQHGPAQAQRAPGEPGPSGGAREVELGPAVAGPAGDPEGGLRALQPQTPTTSGGTAMQTPQPGKG